MTTHTISSEHLRLVIDADGRLAEFRRVDDSHNYAGGDFLWRLYYRQGDRGDIEVRAGDNVPDIRVDASGRAITLLYPTLRGETGDISARIEVRVELHGDDARWSATIANDDDRIALNELHFPLIGNAQLRSDEVLITTEAGGRRYEDVRGTIRAFTKQWPPYYTPQDEFQQWYDTYPGRGAACNCYVLAGPSQGLYVASHEGGFTYTSHQLRLYAGDRLELGMVKYPCLRAGQRFESGTYLVSPYRGSWHAAAAKYRAWADTWWTPPAPPRWVRRMNGWQRLILKHQFGEVYFPYRMLPEIDELGHGVGLDTIFMHGWHAHGHDNQYPDYVCGGGLGTEDEFRHAMRRLRERGSRSLLYVSGRLIDVGTDYYRTTGRHLAIKSSDGGEYREQYRFGGRGTFTNRFANRTFAAACPSQSAWLDELKRHADLAFDFGCASIFYDQMGYAEFPCFDPSHGHPTPWMENGQARVGLLAALRSYVKGRDPEMGLGFEIFFDGAAQHGDYIHGHGGTADTINDWQRTGERPRPRGFIEFFRFAFPEVIISDRDVRDETDLQWRINHAVLAGLRSDVEVHRCRALIDRYPRYQRYLTEINALRTRFADLLLEGTYRDTLGVTSDNADVDARCFTNGARLAVVVAQSHLERATARLAVPGYAFVEAAGVGGACVNAGGHADVPRHGLAVAIYERAGSGAT